MSFLKIIRKRRQNASLILKGSVFILQPMMRAVSGVLTGGEPVKRLELPVPPAELASAIRETLGHSRSGVPHPDPSTAFERTAPLLKAAKVRSWSALARGARLIEIAENAGAIVFTPTENRGGRKGFLHLPALNVTVSKPVNDEDLGEAAIRALELSK